MTIHHVDECPHSPALKKVSGENKDLEIGRAVCPPQSSLQNDRDTFLLMANMPPGPRLLTHP